MTKFITPVAMACTLEQFATDLLQPLLKLGYKIAKSNENPFEGMLIAYHAIPGVNTFRFYKHESWVPFVVPETTHLQEYNPELFLALAAMTDAEYGVAGEWWVAKKSVSGSFTVGGFYQAYKPVNQFKAFIDDLGLLNGFRVAPLRWFRKATKEELVNKFTNDRILREGLAAHVAAEQFLDVFIADSERANGVTAWGSKILDYKEHPALKGFLGKTISGMLRTELKSTLGASNTLQTVLDESEVREIAKLWYGLPLEQHILDESVVNLVQRGRFNSVEEVEKAIETDEKVPTFVNSPWPVKEIIFKDEKPYEPKNGDEVLAFKKANGILGPTLSKCTGKKTYYVGKSVNRRGFIVQLSSGGVMRADVVKPVPAEPEITFEPGELVWVILPGQECLGWLARYYKNKSAEKHFVFAGQKKEGSDLDVVEIHKFDKRPF